MKKLVILLMLFLTIKTVKAQNTILEVSLSNSTASSCDIWIPDVGFGHDYLKRGSFDIPLQSGKGSLEFKITRPQFAYLRYRNSNERSAQRFKYVLYLSPGDHINFKADFYDKENGIMVTGKGSNNNQPLISALAGAGTTDFEGDTLPYRVIAFANKHQSDLKRALDQYIKLYKPSADFIKNEKINISYDAVKLYYDFNENNKFRIGAAYQRNENKWRGIQDSLFATIKLNDSNALTAVNYTILLRTFLLREKERLWTKSYKDSSAFYKEWYNTDVANGKKQFRDDMQNLFQEKIINHYFTDKPAEFLYANLFDDALGEHNPQNIVSIFERFKQKFPHSKYLDWFGPVIDSIRQKENKPLTADMIFVADNGTKLNSFEDLLALTKGKTVLLDMWGTWCGPCRNEISANGQAIKAYFKDKGLDYFYVANHDLAHEEYWKKLIAFFDMKGTHILANAALSNDIMAKVKGQGFPTYVIIKRDGTYEQSKAGYPMNRDILIKQLEAALEE